MRIENRFKGHYNHAIIRLAKKKITNSTLAVQVSTICSIVTDILILIDSSKCLKDAKTMDMVFGINVNFKIVFHRGNSILTAYGVFFQSMSCSP